MRSVVIQTWILPKWLLSERLPQHLPLPSIVICARARVDQEIFRQNSYSRAERSLAALRFFEAALERSGTGFLVGDAPTYVDLGLFYVLYELGEDDNVPDWPSRFELPRLGAFVASMAARPHLADYLASPRRMPRYERDRSGSSLYTYVAGRLSPEIVE